MACNRTTFRDYQSIVKADWLNQVDATVVDALKCATTPAQALSAIAAAAQIDLETHVKDKANPHDVTAAQAGAAPATALNGLSIAVVEALPINPLACTIYFVVGTGNVPTCQ